MRFFETAKLAAGIDSGKKLLGGRKKAAVLHERSAFFLVWHRVFRGAGALPVLHLSGFSRFEMYQRTVSVNVTA